MKLIFLLGLLSFTYALEGIYYTLLLICFMPPQIISVRNVFLDNSLCQSRVSKGVKMVLTPPKLASVTQCAHTTRPAARIMSPFVVLEVSYLLIYSLKHINCVFRELLLSKNPIKTEEKTVVNVNSQLGETPSLHILRIMMRTQTAPRCLSCPV